MTSAPVTPHDFPAIRWHGHWIWVPEEPIEPSGFLPTGVTPSLKEAHGLFRKTIRLDRVPERVPARITADSRYALFVNGQEVMRGPVRSQPRRLHYDLIDLAPYLQAGQNILAVYVKYYGMPTSYWMPAVPNMTLGKNGILVFEADLGEAGWLVSDATWKARKAEAWTAVEAAGEALGGIPIEIFDARRFPHDWRAAAFDDSAWGQAQVVPAVHIGGFARTQPPTDPYGPLYPRSIAPLSGTTCPPARITVETLEGHVETGTVDPIACVEAAVGLPVTATRSGALPLTVDLPAGGAARITIDMGRIVSGFVEFALEALAGTTLDLAYTEEPVTGPSGPIGQHAGTRYVARGEDDHFAVFDSNGLRYATILVHGITGPCTVRAFAVREHVYPWQEGATFECDDADLNRLYAAGVRTVQLCSHDAFIDCPTREQRAWVGDAVVHQMVHLATNTDWRLAWRYLTLADSPRPDGILPMSVVGDIEAGGGITIPDWALHWVHGIYNRYRFDGNRDAVLAALPTVEQILRWYLPYQTAEGWLKDVTEWNLVDWSSVMVQDTSAILTALWARGLREFSEMASWLDERGRQRWADEVYERARANFDAFWDEERGSYVDHIVGSERRPEMSQLAGALAIVSGLAPRERWNRIVDTITDEDRLVVRSWTGGGEGEYALEKMQKQFQGIYEPDWDVEREIVIAEPFMSYTVHDAVVLAGKASLLPNLYRRWLEFLVDGYDTIGECWGWGTHVHGWSCTPTRDMIFYTLGVTPAEPGYTTVRIAPRPGRLSWMRGAVPSPRGLIVVEVSPGSVTIDSPVPILLDLDGQASRTLPSGHHEISIQ